jgi:hypothetical protein
MPITKEQIKESDTWHLPENKMPEQQKIVVVFGKSDERGLEYGQDEWIWRDWSNDGDPDQAWLHHHPVYAWRYLPDVHEAFDL